MSREREAAFARGAAILTAANFATRLLGVIYWPLLTRVFRPFDGREGEAGVGLARIPLASYQIILSFSSVGFNVAISKLIAERLARGDGAGARRVFRVALTLMTVLGVGLTALFWWGAPALAQFAGDPEAFVGFRALAPAMVLMTLTAAYRGLFQGLQQMEPVGISQVVEQILRILAGLSLAAWGVRRSLVWGAAGVSLGDVTGALVAAFYLYAVARPAQLGLAAASGGGSAPVTHAPAGRATATARAAATARGGGGSWWQLAGEIFRLALPISLIGAIMPLMAQADTVMVNRILSAQGLATDAVREAFGQLSNGVQLLWIPAVLTQALQVSLVPAVSESLALGDRAGGARKTRTALRATLLFGLPAAAGLWVLADPIYRVVYAGGGGGPVLAVLAWGSLFLMLQQTSSGALQGLGRVGLSAWNLAAGALVKVVVTYPLLAYTALGARGAAIGTVLGFATTATLNLAALYRELGPVLPWRALLRALAPGTALMAAALWAVGRLLGPMGTLTTLALVGAGALLYGLALLLLRGLEPADLERIPRLGAPAVAWLRRLGLL